MREALVAISGARASMMRSIFLPYRFRSSSRRRCERIPALGTRAFHHGDASSLDPLERVGVQVSGRSEPEFSHGRSDVPSCSRLEVVGTGDIPVHQRLLSRSFRTKLEFVCSLQSPPNQVCFFNRDSCTDSPAKFGLVSEPHADIQTTVFKCVLSPFNDLALHAAIALTGFEIGSGGNAQIRFCHQRAALVFGFATRFVEAVLSLRLVARHRSGPRQTCPNQVG